MCVHGVLTLECCCPYLIRDCNSVLSFKLESQWQNGVRECEGISLVGLFLHFCIILNFALFLKSAQEKHNSIKQRL